MTRRSRVFRPGSPYRCPAISSVMAVLPELRMIAPGAGLMTGGPRPVARRWPAGRW
jgi:hypothetical protein